MSQLAITEATPQTDVLSQIKDIISQKNVELLHLQFIDLEGTLKHYSPS
jgi:glutamine synthetase